MHRRAAVLLSLVIVGHSRLLGQCPDGSPPPCGRPASRPPAPNSIAVLYFDNLSRDTSDAYVADGLTEELITRLGEIQRLQVKSRTAVQRYRGKSIDDPAALARALNVVHLVSGTVQQGGGRLRVTVELTRAVSGTRVWGQSFERPASDLMGVEAEIAQAIAEGVGGRLAPRERQSLTFRVSRNPEAYDHYLRGNYFLARRSPVDVRMAIDQYQEAVGLDSLFTAAQARIGYSYALYLDWGWTYPGLSWDSILTRGFAVSDRALRLDSTAADAWMTRGYFLSFQNPRTFAGVDAAFQRAIALDPRNAEAYHQFGFLLRTAGRDSMAAWMFDRALALEPDRPVTLVNLALMQRVQGRDAEAVRLCDGAVALDPGAAWAFARRAMWRPRSDIAGSLADAQAAVRLEPRDYPIEAEAALASAQFRNGDTTAARARLARITAAFPTVGFQAAYFLSMAYASTGDADGAIAVLQRMPLRGAFLWSITRDPWFDGIRTDARFQQLVAANRPPNPDPR